MFLPLLRNAAESKQLARIVNVSSTLGSCTNTKNSKTVPFSNVVYGMSKV